MQPTGRAERPLTEWTFSILNRIGGDATSRGRGGSPRGRQLSVSSIGSEAMQLLRISRSLPQPRTFSILNRIGGDATSSTRSTSVPESPSFSILNRIGGDATVPGGDGHDGGDDFQYPQSDRRRCNYSGQSLAVTEKDLSVSSIGSEAMQHLMEAVEEFVEVAFSILNRIGGDATRARPGARGCGRALSVSSIGSEAMQLIPLQRVDADCNCHFQYPQSDRRRCNFPRSRSHSRSSELSVSSIGSEAMQPPGRRPAPPLPASFQYPQSDRRRCNCGAWARAHPPRGAFSILNRIGGDATMPLLLGRGPRRTFSILNRIGGDATAVARAPAGN